jgi:hypothetical protein
MDEAGTLIERTATRLPRWLGPLLIATALVLGYGAAERGYETYRSGSTVRGLAATGFALFAIFNLGVGLRLIRRPA